MEPVMNRTGLLAAIAVIVTSAPSFAQFGGMGGVGGGLGGTGGQGMAPGMMMPGGRLAGVGFTEVQRFAQVEMEGGQHISGKIDLRSLVVNGDLGQYVISPDKIKMIRFLKPIDEVKPVNEAEGNNHVEAGGGGDGAVVREAPNRPGMMRAMRRGGGGLGMVADPTGGAGMAALTRGKVITTTDKELIGIIQIPTDLRLELDFGSLTLAPIKLRMITFTEVNPKDSPVKSETAARGSREDAGRPALREDESPPRYFRQGSSVIIISPVGDRAMLYNLETKKAESLELSGTKEAPLEVTPILAQNVVALMLKGPKVTRIAVADRNRASFAAFLVGRVQFGEGGSAV